jgi:hypothetical protein
VNQDQLMLEIFNGLLALQEQSHQILASLTDQGIDWDNWLQLFAILAGIGVVVWQVNKQHKSNIEAQNDKTRTELKIQLRNDLEKYIEELTDATSEATVFPLTLQVSVSMALDSLRQNGGALPLRQRHVHFTDVNAKIGRAAVWLISTIEKHLIVAPELDIFRTAINVALEDMRQTGTVYTNDLLQILPMDVPPEYQSQRGPIINPPLPNGQRMKLIERHGDEYRKAVGTLNAWIYDLRVAIQNVALIDLFPANRLECRKPLGNSEIVINPKDPEAISRLRDYFENETTWGKNKQEAEAWVRKENERTREAA